MKRVLLIIGLYILASTTIAWGQNFPMTDVPKPTPHYDRPVNFGVKGGFTSSLFLATDLRVNGVAIDEIQNNYKIGYFGSVFMRINFERHFLQPEISYAVNRCNITFNKPLPTDAPIGSLPAEASITSSIHSVDIPVIYGYNFIKEGPYSLAVFGGPKIRYIMNRQSHIDFENFDQQNIKETLHPLNFSFTLGVAVNISRIFFDFRYDIGLHNMSKRISYELPPDATNDYEIHFSRRDNVLSFSLGVLL